MFSITSYFLTHPDASPTACALTAAFGLSPGTGHKFTLCEDLRIDLAPSQILFITGQSGSGKSCILRILQRCLSPAVDLNRLRLRPEKLLPDHFHLPLRDALYFLSLAGLADAHIFLRKPAELSDGQLFRFKLALALARKPKFIFIDGFLDNLDRLTAQILAHNVRKFADRTQTAFILASPHNDFLDQLQPDLYLEKLFSESPLVTRTPARRPATPD